MGFILLAERLTAPVPSSVFENTIISAKVPGQGATAHPQQPTVSFAHHRVRRWTLDAAVSRVRRVHQIDKSSESAAQILLDVFSIVRARIRSADMARLIVVLEATGLVSRFERVGEWA